MNAGTGTGQTSPSTRKPLKPRKFRTSCDGCSASKVKCNQDNPQCLRCINLGLVCNYSPSRRMGKPAASSRKLKTTTYSPSSSESEHTNFKPIKKAGFSPPSFSGNQQMRQLPSPEHETSPFDSTFIHNDLIFMGWHNGIFQTLQPSEIQPAATNPFDSNVDFIPNSLPQLPRRDHFMFPEHPSLDLKKAPSQNPTYDLFPQDVRPQINTSPVSITLSPTLCTHSLDCQDTYSQCLHPANTSMDHVLLNNRAQIDNAYSLLACSCSDNPQFALNIALICTKILETYEDIIKAFSTCCISPISGRRLSSSDSIPITVGAYKMDAEDEERMRIQIVLIELRKVKGLVDTFAMKYCNGVEGVNRSGDEIYLALERFLRLKLDDILQDLVTRLES